VSANDLLSALPLIALVVWACLLLIIDLFIPDDRKGWTALLAALGLLVSLVLDLIQPLSDGGSLMGGMIALDGFAIFLNALFLIGGLIGILIAHDYLRRMGIERGEYYPLLLFSISGMMLMSMAADLIVVFLALELLSFPLYILSGFARPRPESEEAALKYFLLGAFATSFVVYGIALTFGATGTTSLQGIVSNWASIGDRMPLLLIGSALILIGLGFKVAVVPFHMWTPDVYQGAPTAIVGFMAFGAKAGGFAGLLRIFFTALPQLSADIVPVTWGIAAATMVLGNILAISQSNIKRMLAYSSIAHAGYILMALVPFGSGGEVSSNALASALFYLLAYGLTNFAAWAVVIALEKAEGQGLQLDDYAGLGRKYPLLAACMAIAMFSFTGVPPTLGFVGKFYLFQAVLSGGYVWLAVIGVITSLISAFYYLRLVVIMYMRDGDPVARSETWLNVAAVVSAAATLLLIVFSSPIFNAVTRAGFR
jgi:NADH-quinone oxidoreductase subunit N